MKCYLKITKNNVFLTVYDIKGNIVVSTTAGRIGMKGPKKRTVLAAELVGKEIGQKALSLGIKSIILCIEGIISKKVRGVVTGLLSGGVSIIGLEYRDCLAHNGVRMPREKRR